METFKYYKFLLDFMGWRAKVDQQLRNHLEKQIAETGKHRVAYSESKDPGNAQLWVAVANISREIVDLSLKLKYLEGAIKDITQKQDDVLNQVSQQISQLQAPKMEEGELPKVEFIVDAGKLRKKGEVKIKPPKVVKKVKVKKLKRKRR